MTFRGFSKAKFLVGILFLLMTLPVIAEPLKKISKRKDGTNLYWSIERASDGEKQGILLIAQGSGCLPAIQAPVVSSVKLVAPDFAVLLVEKYGVTHEDKPEHPMNDCTDEYFSNHTVSQRVEDVRQVLEELKDKDWWSGELVLFGGSEGGAVVARLSPKLNPEAVVVFSSGLGEPLIESLMRVLPPPVQVEAKMALADARKNPENGKIFGGNSYRWWADVMDAVLINDLLESRIPVLLIHGEMDQFSPVQSARASYDAFKAEKRCDLTYWEFPDYDHFMTDSSGVNHRDEVFNKVASWVGIVRGGVNPGCE